MRGATRAALISGPHTGTAYYVSLSGSDSNSGKSPSSPFLTIAKVNALVLKAGDRVLFQGGQTFSGGISFGAANYSAASPPSALNPITVGSYGGGLATISSASISGFASLNIGAWIVRDLIFVGGGISSTTVDGVVADNNLSGNVKLPAIKCINLTISQYGGNGIWIKNSTGTSGFNGVHILNCTTHDCTGGTTPGSGTSGILIQSPLTGYSLGSTFPCFLNVEIRGCVSFNNTGKAGDGNWVGSGIFVGEVSNCIISNCVAFNNGANNSAASGPVGIWCADCINVIIQFCEAYANKTASTGDGGGFDIDGGAVNCLIQYCYSHDNYGCGFLVYSYNDGAPNANGGQVTGTSNCTVRYCISQNDGVNPSTPHSPGATSIGNDAATVTNILFYGNIIYNNLAAIAGFFLEGSSAASITGHLANNIFVSGSSGGWAINTNTVTPGASLVFAGNDYFTLGTFKVAWGASNYSTFAAWQAATGQEKIGGVNVGFNVNPNLNSAGGGGTLDGYNPGALSAYQLAHGSPLIGVGVDVNASFSIVPGPADFFGDYLKNGVGTGFNIGADGANR